MCKITERFGKFTFNFWGPSQWYEHWIKMNKSCYRHFPLMFPLATQNVSGDLNGCNKYSAKSENESKLGWFCEVASSFFLFWI